MGKVMFKPHNFFLEKTFLKKRLVAIKNSLNLYSEVTDYKNIENYQIRRFNSFWRKAYTNHPFYIKWKSDHKLPSKVSSISELSDFPILNKKIINENYDLIFHNLKFKTTYTGGTSGITTRFPTNAVEAFNAYVVSYTGRLWWNIKPLSDILMLWGHSHLFQGGIKGKLEYHFRKFKDFTINTKRISSYDLSEKNLKFFFDIINDLSPRTLISYSGNVFKLAKFMDENNLNFKFGKIENVIVTSEPIYTKDIELIKKKFAFNIINEYGMAETGVIGYSKNKTQNIKVFWRSFILTHDKNANLYLTTISERVFPLINYDTEDKVVTRLVKANSILGIKEILGKSRNNLKISMKDGSTKQISTIYFDHIFKYIPNIYSVQYKICHDIVYIILNSNQKIDLQDATSKCVKRIFEDFGLPDEKKLKIILAKSSKTAAGKHAVLIK